MPLLPDDMSYEAWAVPPRAVLLAMPYWTRDGWDVADYTYERSDLVVRLSLHHCRDDEIVPHTHLELHAVACRRP